MASRKPSVIERGNAAEPDSAQAAARPRRRKAVRRAEILGSAAEVFMSQPYAQASIKDIARRAGCVEGTIYTYFRNKQELFDAVLAAFYDALIADITPRFALIRDTRDRLRFLIARHLQIALDHPGVGILIVRDPTGQGSYFGSHLHQLNRRYSRFLLQTLSEGIQRGELRADLDVSLARDLVFGGLEHRTFNARGRDKAFDPVAIAESLVTLLMEGWAARPAREPLAALSDRIDRLEASLQSRRRQT